MNFGKLFKGILLAFIFVFIFGLGLVAINKAMKTVNEIASIGKSFLPGALAENLAAADFGTALPTEIQPESPEPAARLIPVPDTSAKAALVAKFDYNGNETILLNKNGSKKLFIASISKLVTAAVAIDNYDFSKNITISKTAESVGPGLKAGQIFSVKNILYAALVESNNPAAYALSEPMGTDIFVGKMNEKAQQLGMGSTYFKNPVGYLGENYSTAQDVAKLGFGLVKNYPQILQITSVPEYNIFTYDGKFDHTAKSTDELIADPSVPWRNFIIGGKTGDNELAGKCLMIVIKSPDNLGYIVSVVLGSENRFSDMEKIINPLFKGYYEPR